jgi:hypothetical protein
VGRPGCRKFESFVGNLRGFAPTTHRKKWISATVPKCTFLIIILLSDCLIPIDFTC